MKHRALSILLAVVFLLSVFMFCTTAFAAENTADGVTAVLDTDKAAYAAGESVTVTLKVTNNSFLVSNIVTELVLPEGLTLTEGVLVSDAADIPAGESAEYGYALATPVPVPSTTVDEGGDSAPETGDIRASVYGILALASFAGLIALTFGSKLLKQRWFVLIVCAAVLLGTLGPVAASASVTAKSFEVVRSITVDGAAAELKAIVSYDLDNNELTTSEVEFKKDGKSLYSLVPEKGWYTASNKGIKVDGVAASNTSRPEVTASYIDMLFGCTSTKTGNFVKGEFDNAQIISDDAERQLLVGLTKDVASRKALAHIKYNEWIIAEIDGKLVVTGWFDNATAAAARYLYNLVKGQDNVTLNLPITGKVDGFVTNIPQPTVGTFDGGMDGSEGTMVLSYSDMDEAKFLTYAKELEAAGFTLYAENKILNYGQRYNLFRTYTKGESAVHISFLPDDFVHADATKLTPNEQSYLSRSFRSSGCEMRIVTDSTKHLFTNDAANKYEDAGITPKLSLVNLYNQVAVGNDKGACVIYTLADGSFIVVDGGFAQDADHVYKTLKELNEREDGKIVVAAWIMSHHHGDHIGAFNAIADKEYAKEINIEQFIYNPTASSYFWRMVNAPYNYQGDFNYAVYNNVFIAEKLAKFGDGNAKIINPHMGQVMQIRNADVEFLYTGDEDMFPLHMDNSNDSSMVFTVNFDMGTETAEDDTRVLMMNDACCDSAYAVLHPLFSRVMDCDIVQVGHHGFGGPSTATYRMMAPSVGIWCTDEATTTKLNHFVPKTNKDGSLAGGSTGGSAGFLVYRSPDDTNPPVDLVLLADKYVQTLNLPYTAGDVINKRILTDHHIGLYDTEEVDVAFLPAFRFQTQFSAKYEDILSELESYDADVMILTQIDQLCTAYNKTEVIGKLMADLDFTYYAYAPVWNANKDFSGNMETGEGTMGHLIMSRYPITSAETVVLVEGNTTSWAKAEGRGFCHAVLNVDGLDLDIYATHLSDDSINGFNAALAGDHKPTGDYWMIVGNCNQAAYEDGIKKVAPVAGNLNGGNFEVYGDANIEFTNAKIHDNWKAMINQNMEKTYTFTAVLSRYLASDNVMKPTPETDMMYWWINRYGGSASNMNTIINELKYVHPEIAVLVVVDNYAVAEGTPEYLAEQTGYKYSYYVKSWTGSETSERGHMILSDIELQPQEDIILVEDNGPTATEGRAFGHVIMTIDGEEVDVYFGVTDSSNGMVAQLEAIVKANAEASGRQFIVSGYKFANVGTTYAGQKVTNYMIDPGHSIILSNGDLTVAEKTVRAKTEVGIASPAISDQIWIEFGEPVEEEKPEEDDGITKVMSWWLNSYTNENALNAILRQLKEADADIVSINGAGDIRMPSFTLDSFIEQTGYEYWYYQPNVNNENGTTQGCLMLSKTQLTFVEATNYPNQYGDRYFTYLTTEISNREINLFMGWDIGHAAVESYVQGITETTGNDFVIMAHNFKGVGATYAGKEVVNVSDSSGNNALIVSQVNQKIESTEIVAKDPTALSWAGFSNQLIANLEVTPKVKDTKVMTWWLNSYQNENEVAAIIRQLKEADADIATILAAGDSRMPSLALEEFIKMTGYEYWYYVANVTNANGSSQGCLMLSKTPLTYVDQSNYPNQYGNRYFTHLTTAINNRELDLFMGYDMTPANVESVVKEAVDASGNDFIIFGHNFTSVNGTYAGREVLNVKEDGGITSVLVSLGNQKVTGTQIVAKDAALSWAGHTNQVIAELDITPKELTNVMAWWLNGWQNDAHVAAMIEEIKAQDQDIAVIVSAGNFRYAGITVEQFAEMTGYEHWYFEPSVTNADGTQRGNLILSKTELTYVDHYETNNVKFSYLTTVLNGRETDLFVGYDVKVSAVEPYIAEKVAASGNDFLVFAFLLSEDGQTNVEIGDTFAGRSVVAYRDPASIEKNHVYVIASGANQDVVDTFMAPKPEILSWPGYLDQVHMVLDVGTPEKVG